MAVSKGIHIFNTINRWLFVINFWNFQRKKTRSILFSLDICTTVKNLLRIYLHFFNFNILFYNLNIFCLFTHTKSWFFLFQYQDKDSVNFHIKHEVFLCSFCSFMIFMHELKQKYLEDPVRWKQGPELGGYYWSDELHKSICQPLIQFAIVFVIFFGCLQDGISNKN